MTITYDEETPAASGPKIVYEERRAAPKKEFGGAANLLANPDAMLALGSGMVAAPVSGFAGAAGTLLPGPPGQGADWQQRTQEALTVAPKTQLGSAMVNAASKPGEWLAQFGDFLGRNTASGTGSPALGAGVNAVVQAAPAAIGLRGSTPKAAVAPTLREQAVANAREAGFSLTPDDMGAGRTSKTIAGLAGEPKLAKLISIKNREQASALVAEDFGLPKDTPMSRATTEQIRENQGASYQTVRESGTVTLDGPLKKDIYDSAKDLMIAARELPHRTENPLLKTVKTFLSRDKLDANTIVSEIINLRGEAKQAFAKQDAQAGRGNLAIAEALEGVLDRHLSKPTMGSDLSGVPGNPAAMQALKEARAVIAKTYAADRAMNPVTGEFNPQAYAHMLKNKVPLTGGPKKIAEAATAFPRSLQNPSGLPPPNASFFDLFVGRGLGLGMMGDIASAGARPVTRSALASDIGQGILGAEITPLTPGVLQAIAASQAQQQQGRRK